MHIRCNIPEFFTFRGGRTAQAKKPAISNALFVVMLAAFPVAGSAHYLPEAQEPDPTAKLISTIVVGERPRYVVFSPDGETAYVAHNGEPSVKVIRVSDHSVIETIDIAADGVCTGMDITPDGQFLYVAHGHGHVVVPVRLSDGEVLPPIAVDGWPEEVSVSPDGGLVYVTGYRGLDAIDVNTNSIVAHVDVPPIDDSHFFFGTVFSPDGMYAYITDNYDYREPGKVHIVRTTDHTIIDTISVPKAPYYIDINPDGETIWVPSHLEGVTVAIRLSDGSLQTIPVDGRPSGVAVSPAGQYVYVGTGGTEQVHVIRISDYAFDPVLGVVPNGYEGSCIDTSARWPTSLCS